MTRPQKTLLCMRCAHAGERRCVELQKELEHLYSDGTWELYRTRCYRGQLEWTSEEKRMALEDLQAQIKRLRA